MKPKEESGAMPNSSPQGSPDSTADSIAPTINQSVQHDRTPIPDSEAPATAEHGDFQLFLPYDVWDEGPGPEDDPYDPGDFYKNSDDPAPGKADEDDDVCLHCTGMDCTYCNKDVYAWED